MENESFGNLDIPLLFYKKDNKCYCSINERSYEVNTIFINKLREQLVLPFNIEFIGLSKKESARIIEYFADDTITTELRIYSNIILATFYKSIKYIDVYKVPNINSLYTRVNNCNPYLYTNTTLGNILIELPKEVARERLDDCYFLASDLKSSEKEYLDLLHKKVPCEHIYRLEKNKKLIKRKY